MLLRSLAVLVLLVILLALGIIDPANLPWHSTEFRVSGVTVMVYLLWSASESRYRGGGGSLPYAVFYSVLLVSALDSFLLELTVFGPPWFPRWAGLALFTAGSAVRLRAFRTSSSVTLRTGRYLQLAGLPAALGSISGLAVALAAGVPGSLHEEMDAAAEEERE